MEYTGAVGGGGGGGWTVISVLKYSDYSSLSWLRVSYGDFYNKALLWPVSYDHCYTNALLWPTNSACN